MFYVYICITINFEKHEKNFVCYVIGEYTSDINESDTGYADQIAEEKENNLLQRQAQKYGLLNRDPDYYTDTDLEEFDKQTARNKKREHCHNLIDCNVIIFIMRYKNKINICTYNQPRDYSNSK